MIYDVIIIGGGPAGLMAANQFEDKNINYLILEKNERFGKKLLLTGGRRCNLTNNLSTKAFIDHLTVKHKKFIYKSLNVFGPKEIKSYFSRRGLELVLEDGWKYFPKTGKSASVLDVLTKNIQAKHIRFNHSVRRIEKLDDGFNVFTKQGCYQSYHVIVATGSNSFPSTGSSGDGLVFAKQFDICYHEFRPAETYIYSKQVVSQLGRLKGLSIKNVLVKVLGVNQSYQDDLLVTHIGLSGPVIMHLSEFIDEDLLEHGLSTLEIRFIQMHEEEFFQLLHSYKNERLDIVLKRYANKKVVDVILNQLGVESKKIGEMSHKQLRLISQSFTRYQVRVDKVEDKEKAFVNKGGIDLKEMDPRTMAIKKVEGLYFIGEIMNLHGPIGGYNLTIALSTGYLSSQHIINRMRS